MKQETKMKCQRAWMRFKQEVKEIAPCAILGSGIGMLIGGYFGTIENSKQIRKTNQKLAAVAQHVDYHSDILNQHADAGNACVAREDKMEQEIEELRRQNNILMEKALQNTKGE